MGWECGLGALAMSLGLLGQGTSTWVAWAIAGCQTGFEGVLGGFSAGHPKRGQESLPTCWTDLL